MSRRTFTREFKLSVCRDIELGKLNKGQACRQHGIGSNLLRTWLDQYQAKGDDAFTGSDWRASTQTTEARMKELEAALGRAHLEIDFLKDVIAKKSSAPRSGSK